MRDAMDEKTFQQLQSLYSPIINDIIKSNVKFYRTSQTIRWRFSFDERVAIIASCDKKTNTVSLNIAAVDFAFRIKNEPLQIEYFLLHEIRHIYQHLEIEDYKTDPSKCNNVELAKKWFEEESNYTVALDNNGNENEGYFDQDIEMDAYAYAYAVITYKYGKVPYLYVPKAYENSEFNQIVSEWHQAFVDEGL